MTTAASASVSVSRTFEPVVRVEDAGRPTAIVLMLVTVVVGSGSVRTTGAAGAAGEGAARTAITPPAVNTVATRASVSLLMSLW